jgi:hypothetical protein
MTDRMEVRVSRDNKVSKVHRDCPETRELRVRADQ